MKTLKEIMSAGPVGAAGQMHKDGQGQESNPYPKGSAEHDKFWREMSRLQQQELRDMMGWAV
jgi:hypothetical protein